MLNHLGVWSGIAGLAVALIFGVGPHMGFKMPAWLARAGFITGIALLLASPLIFLFGDERGVPTNVVTGNSGSNVVVGPFTGTNTQTIINPIVRDIAGLYQVNEQVGKVRQPSIDEAHGTASFAVATFSAYPNLNQPLEYKNLLLECENLPKPMPNTFVANLVASVIGFQCRIVGHK